MTPEDVPVRRIYTRGITINQNYQDILEENNLVGFDQLYNYPFGETLKRIPERQIIRFELLWQGPKRVFYLKRHETEFPDFGSLMTAGIKGAGISSGMIEFNNICEFRKHGLPTVSPVAAGERRIGMFKYQSFLITESFEPYIALEQLMAFHPSRLRGEAGSRYKRKLIEAVAKTARRMHAAGANHQDFNATHVLIGPENIDGMPKLALFDLQRVDRRRWQRFRWMIKALAELNYTLPDTLFSRKDRLKLFMDYKAITRLSLWSRFQLYWIVKKIGRIRRHTLKNQIRRKKSGHEAR